MAQIPHEPHSWTKAPTTHSVEQGTPQTQTLSQLQVGQLTVVVVPPVVQVAWPRSKAPQLRSTAEQVVPEQFTVLEPPQLAMQVLFGGTCRFAAKTAPSGAEGAWAAVDGL